MTDKKTEALKLSLEALECIWDDGLDGYPESMHSKAITDIREALAEQPAQPSKPWVGLTTADLDEIDAPIRERGSATISEIYRAIEAKLREKNT